ncbi:MFS transporter [Kordiimonas sediminis]|uniref:MFS transporter n=2 Tax=Kordiimonas sediminis TaxID=1735581 RepID=A0A919E5H1_9PROT|nr:MFS transporter [Kordiimonas sediminis]
MFALATTPYAWKFLWSPIVDRLGLGRFSHLFGRRRSWLFLIQVLLVALILVMSQLDPETDVEMIALTVIGIGFLSASQDIVIDAYRIEILQTEQLGHGASMIAFGYRASNLIAGYGVLMAAEYIGWSAAIACLSVLVLPGLVAALWVGEPSLGDETYIEEENAHLPSVVRKGAGAWFYDAVVLPFKEFLTRENAILILLFVLTMKAGDAVAAIMTGPLIVELGFTESEMANANKLVGTIALWVGIAFGSVLYFRAGVYRSLMFTGVLMMVTNLVFAWLSTQGNDVTALAITIGAENFASGLGNTVIIAYLSSLCNLSFTATQYALLSSLSNQARSILGAFSGSWAESMGWIDFFIFSTFLAVPGLVILGFLWYRDVGNTAKKATEGHRVP